MKVKILAIFVVLIFLMIGLSGCNELEELNKPNYIIVNVQLGVWVIIQDGNEKDYPEKALISAEIIKDGGERVSDIINTQNSLSGKQILEGTFNLYKEQDIVCIANPVLESLSEYSDYTFNSASTTITWEMAKQNTDWGETVSFDPDLNIIGTKNN